ncbi:DUF4286 family protein [Flavobacteriales bacterium]|nr:DUF4286 family protein [Flavobacteriales bacterium]MDG1145657.1 DUF4286 family protein [Flavobacteriales bacterium]MDG1395569.1 DUF4286 family protein [Flavobacteriales bacterium]
MIIYNVTVNIDETVHQEWLDWMNTKHIAKVMNTGLFTAAKMSKVLVEEQMGGLTYSIQYTCESITKVEEYKAKFAAELQEEHTKKFQGKFVAFRTLLEVVNEF